MSLNFIFNLQPETWFFIIIILNEPDSTLKYYYLKILPPKSILYILDLKGLQIPLMDYVS